MVRRGFAPATLLVIVATSTLVVWRPTLAVGSLVGLTVVTFAIWQVRIAVLVYVAAEPFAGYLSTLSGSAIKLIGAGMFVAWVIRVVRDGRRVHLGQLALLGAAALLVVLLASTVANSNGSAGLATSIRYVSYLAALVVLVDTMRTRLAVETVAAVFVLSCTVAAIFGFVHFLTSGGGRAAGPMPDANDFAFYLISAVPFAVMLARRPTRWRHAYSLAVVILLLTTLTTFSRGAIVGLAAMLVVAIALGLIRMRSVVVGASALAVAVGAVVYLAPTLVERSLQQKQYIASSNVTSRYSSWKIAAEVTADHPLLGSGPGGFQINSSRYSAGQADTTHLDVAHEMYLQVSSELGLLGLGAFVTVLAGGILGARRALRRVGTQPVAAAVLVSFAGTLVAAAFLSEQYYLPIWLLAAFGATLDPMGRGVV